MKCQVCVTDSNENFDEKPFKELTNHVYRHYLRSAEETEENGLEEMFKRCFPDAFDFPEELIRSDERKMKELMEKSIQLDQYCREKLAQADRYMERYIFCNLCRDKVNILTSSYLITITESLEHIFNKHLQANFVCPDCDYGTTSPRQFRAHLAADHPTVKRHADGYVPDGGIDHDELFGLIDQCYGKSAEKTETTRNKRERFKRQSSTKKSAPPAKKLNESTAARRQRPGIPTPPSRSSARLSAHAKISAMLTRSASKNFNAAKISAMLTRSAASKNFNAAKKCFNQNSIQVHAMQLRNKFPRGRSITCGECSVQVIGSDVGSRTIINHVLEHHLGRKLYFCKLCRLNFFTDRSVFFHINKEHKKSGAGNYRNGTMKYKKAIEEWLTKCFGGSGEIGETKQETVGKVDQEKSTTPATKPKKSPDTEIDKSGEEASTSSVDQPTKPISQGDAIYRCRVCKFASKFETLVKRHCEVMH